MASIIVTYVHSVDGTNAYQYDMPDAMLDRIITWLRNDPYANVDPATGAITQASKNAGRKGAAKGFVAGLKDGTKRWEHNNAATTAIGNVPDIPITEV